MDVNTSDRLQEEGWRAVANAAFWSRLALPGDTHVHYAVCRSCGRGCAAVGGEPPEALDAYSATCCCGGRVVRGWVVAGLEVRVRAS